MAAAAELKRLHCAASAARARLVADGGLRLLRRGRGESPPQALGTSPDGAARPSVGEMP